MATLVFSTIGTVLGGPLGGAIGALIGQSFDQALLAPATRGPRLGDLSVQTSSYGTQIPRIYGTMRVAGSVVWATDLAESAATTGAKGQPDTTFSYSVSFAVALSSRPAGSIGRIWADGKLLRGEQGDFKVSTTFRYYGGSEEQAIDPLIGSIEGVASTPAYRGLALAVFESLELAEFGNRIPFLTFEILADAVAPPISAILADASAGAIASDAPSPIIGYAAYGPSVRSAVQPLVDLFAVKLFDDGSTLRPPLGKVAEAITEGDFGSSADNQKAAKVHREQAPSRGLPAVLRLTYYDPARDYQAGESRARASEAGGTEEQRELPAVLDAAAAKSLAQETLGRSWASRDRLTLRLPPSYLGLEPGAEVVVPLSPDRWTVNRCTIDGLVVVVELQPAGTGGVSVPADGGRIVQNADVVAAATTLALFDVPDLLGQTQNARTLILAASTPSRGWRSRGVEIDAVQQQFMVSTAARKSILGRSLNVLAAGQAFLIDGIGQVEIDLVDSTQWLVSCDDEALAAGTNLAILGSEVIQFGSAVPNGPGRFILTRLLRGRGGTDWASSSHTVDEPFALVDRVALRAVEIPAWASGSAVTASIISGGVPPSPRASTIFESQSLRPLSPTRLQLEWLAGGELKASWTRRSRMGSAWVDGIDTPLGESSEQYRVTLVGSAGTAELSADSPQLTVSAAVLSALCTGSTAIEVRQVGDWGVSPPCRITFLLS